MNIKQRKKSMNTWALPPLIGAGMINSEEEYVSDEDDEIAEPKK